MYNTLMQIPNYYRVGAYIRLSEADEGKAYESESESIINQRSLLLNFAKEKGFIYTKEYVDDGYSGTNFDRPGFLELLEDIKNGVINTVLVKDLSRLGRDHVMTGYYVETFFPENNIRFISMQEGIDSAINQASNDSATFLFACNDYYSKQNSIKIRNVLNDKRNKGKFIGSAPSYGYMRDPLDKGHLIPDPEYAPVVKKIFQFASEGMRITDITSYLNDNKIKTPSSLKRRNPKSNMRYNETWTVSSVKKILKNEMYIGNMVQGTQTKISYKSNKKKTLPRNVWKIIENTHEPLVDKLTFERVQYGHKRTTTNNSNREKRLFENLLFCKECGNTLTISYRRNHNYWTINCNRYSRDPKRRLCEPHFIPYEKLEKALLETIIKTCKKYIELVEVKKLSILISDKTNNQNKDMDRIDLLNKKVKECISKIDMLYEDKFKGNISEMTYKRLSKETELQLERYQKELEYLKEKHDEIPINKKDIKLIEEQIRKIINIEKPSRELLQTIIDKIIIDKDKNIEIIYKFNLLNFFEKGVR